MEELNEPKSLLDRVRERAGITPAPEPIAFEDDLVPAVEPIRRNRDDDAIDAVLGGIDIIEAYRMWIGKMEPKVGSKRESIMVSCPKPNHRDSNPSAWLNLDKGTWFCGACQEGGDSYDFAAWAHGFDVPGYKTDGSFPELRKSMAQDLGIVIRKTLSGREYAEVITSEPEVVENRETDAILPNTSPDNQVSLLEQVRNRANIGTSTTSATSESNSENFAPNDPSEIDVSVDSSSPGAAKTRTADENIVLLPPAAETADASEPPVVPWREIIPKGTFLYDWMTLTSKSDLPEEYYFWLGMLAVGFAAGNDVTLADSPFVRPNLFVCLNGPSGIGKSRSIHYLTRLIHAAMPYDREDFRSKGVLMAPMPGSAEALVDIFSRPEYDAADPTKIVGYAPVRGLIRFDELASLTGRANRTGSTIKPTLMEFFDSYGPIELVSRGKGHVKAENHFASAVTTTQPASIRNLLMQADADSGFVNRWIFASGPMKPLQSLNTEMIDIESLVPALQGLRTWSSRGRNIELRGDALALWDRFFHAVIEPIRKGEEASIMTRTDLMLKKCILLFSINEQVDVPSEDIVRRACELFDYFRKSYEAPATKIGIGEFEDCRMAIKQALLQIEMKTGKPGTMRDLNRAVPNRYQRDLMTRVLKTMIDLDEVVEEHVKTGRGRPTVRIRYAG